MIRYLEYVENKLALLRKVKKESANEQARYAKEFGNPHALKKLYVWPRLQDKNPADEAFETVDTSKPCLEVLVPFFQDINDKKDGRNHLFILGDAGMGKSSLLLMLKLESMEFFSKSRFNFELKKIGPNTISEIESIPNKIDTILLLDALDEDVISWGNVKSRIREIVKHTLEFKKVIITCRTQFFPVEDRNLLHNSGVINLFDYKITALFISLFKEKEIDEYLKKKFNKNKAQVSIAKKTVGRMKELRARPLVLSHIDDLLSTNTSYDDVYTVYEAMMSAWLKRECRKHQHITPEQLRLGCYSLAINMSVKHERSITPYDINKLLDSDRLLEGLSKTDIGGRSLLNKNSDGHFRFTHYSIQEFLISEAIVHGLIEATTMAEIHITDLMKMLLAQGSLRQKNRLFSKGSLSKTNIDIHDESLAEAAITSNTNKPVINLFCSLHQGFKNQSIEQQMFIQCKWNGIYTRNIIDDSDFIECTLSNSENTLLDIRKSRFDNCNLVSAQFTDCSCANTVFRAVDFSNADFSGTEFTECHFIDCLFDDTNFSKAKFTACSISNPEVFKTAKTLAEAIIDEDTLENLASNTEPEMTRFKAKAQSPKDINEGLKQIEIQLNNLITRQS